MAEITSGSTARENGSNWNGPSILYKIRFHGYVLKTFQFVSTHAYPKVVIKKGAHRGVDLSGSSRCMFSHRGVAAGC